jgi:hypothetical protein
MMGKGHKHYKPIEEFSNNFALDRKIKEACLGLKPCTQHLLMELPTDQDRELIANYIIEWANTYGNGIMMSVNTKISYITSLVYLSRYLGYKKSFKQMTREDIIDGYLKSIKRDFSQDPDQKWVNTYRTRANKILTFWKWLTQPDLKPEERQVPPQLKGLKVPRRKTRFGASNEGGQTFSDKINLSNTTDADSWRVEIAGEGADVVVSWWETNQTSDTSVARISTDAGQTFGPMLRLAANGTISSTEGEEGEAE